MITDFQDDSPWVEKYRPQKLDDYMLNSDLKTYFRSMIQNNKPQNLLFSGIQGTGKTTLARVIANEFKCETKYIKCSTHGTLEILRSEVEPFCNAMSFDGRRKLVILDELDSASSGSTNNFQMGLRTLIEAASDDTCFIATCNYLNKIIPAIQSRCIPVPLKYDKMDLLQRVRYILDAEKIKYNRDSLKAFIEESFKFYPDCRKIINYLQFCCNSGELIVKFNQASDGDKDIFIAELFKQLTTCSNLLEVRQFYLKHKDKIPDFVIFGSDIYNKAIDSDLITEDGVLKLTDQLYQLNTVIDKEATIFGMLTAIRKYKK